LIFLSTGLLDNENSQNICPANYQDLVGMTKDDKQVDSSE